MSAAAKRILSELEEQEPNKSAETRLQVWQEKAEQMVSSFKITTKLQSYPICLQNSTTIITLNLFLLRRKTSTSQIILFML